MFNGSYSKECDMWSVGVMTFMLLSRTSPFNGRNELELKNKIQTNDYEFKERYWSGISESAISFIQATLNPIVSKRLTPKAALSHPWMTG